jgi:hypothetical protein
MFPTFGLGSLGSESRDIRLVIRNVFSNGGCHRVPAFLLFETLWDFSVSQVTSIEFETFKLFGQGTKALLGKEVVWLENLRLANEEVRTLYFLVSFHLAFKEVHEVSNELRA